MDQIISKAVEIGELVRETDACKRLILANNAFEADEALKEDIRVFEECRAKLMELEQAGGAQEEIEALNKDVMNHYEKIMVNPTMVEVTDAKQGVDEMISTVVRVIGSCIIDTAGDQEGCAPSDCAGCSGCSN